MSTEDEVDVRMTQRKLSPTEMTMNTDFYHNVIYPQRTLTQTQSKRLELWLDNHLE